MDSPFGTSNQGGYRGPSTSTQQPAPQQNYGGFGSQQAFGGYQGFGGPQQQQGFGGYQGGFNPMFGGIGGLGFNPMMGPQFMQPMPFFGGFGGFGGFNPYQQQQLNPYQQFNPFQGGYGGGFSPMFGGIGGMGFNPMMGPQFMQPMQQLQNPYAQSMFGGQAQKLRQEQQQFNPNQNYNVPMDMRYRGGPEMSPEMRQRREQDMQMMESQARALLTGATTGDITLGGRTEQNNPAMMALQQAALRHVSPQELATPVKNWYSLPSNNWWESA